MKVILVFLFVCIYSLTFSQYTKISSRLHDELNGKSAEYIDLIVYLNETPNFDSLNKILAGADFDTRVRTVSKSLQDLANRTQPSVIEFISDNYKHEFIPEFRTFWIINAISFKSKPSLIFALSELSDVRYLDLNSGRYSLLEPFDFIKAEESVKNNTEPGLRAINAHLLWEMGYSGRNTLFLSMDTGVFPEHPAISDNFAGNHWPMSQCWYGVRNPEPTDHSSSSHGTHTTGTVLGLDPLTNDTIGVAFNSMWIASDPVGGGNQDLLNPVDFMAVFQWVMDPDGNPETTDDVPRVINNSWGYDYSLAAEFDACSMTEAEVLIAIEAAGICSPFSAGNSGPGASTIGFPALLAFNEVNPMAIGAVNISNNIADFSSRGPTPCIEEEGPLKIKPEVCAPGVNVRSCAGLDSYAYLSGTSMACPHVAGALLLLIEAFPLASAYELKNALYQTAIDLGEPGEDNVYGNGLIDVYAAFHFLADIYEPAPPVNNDYDLMVNIISPVKDLMFCDENNQNIEIKISNSGLLPIDGFSLKVYINDVLHTDTVFSDLIESDIHINYSFNYDFLMSGKNNIRAIVKPLNDYPEFNRFNNYDITYIRKINQTETPFYENFNDFSSNINDSDWLIINENRLKTWEIAEWGDGEKALSLNFRDYGSRNGEKDHALIPQFLVPDWENVYLNFSYAYQKRLESLYNDSLLVKISLDCGQSFYKTIFREGGENLATVPGNSHSIAFVPNSSDDFNFVSLNLNEFKNQDIIISFTTKNDRGSALFIDQVEISEQSININPNFTFTEFDVNIFPNPAKNKVYYEIKGFVSEKVYINVFDITGKKLIHYAGEGKTGEISINHLSTGVYFLSISSGNYTVKKKLIKL